MTFSPLLLLALAAQTPQVQSPTPPIRATQIRATQPGPDRRSAYDVLAYRIDLEVDPAAKHIAGTVAVELVVLEEGLVTIQLDLSERLEVSATRLSRRPLEAAGDPPRGRPVYFKHAGERLDCQLDGRAKKDQHLTLVVAYSGSPGELDPWHGVRWSHTDEGQPRVDLTTQNVGAHHWFPCKSSYHHPEDRPRRLLVNLTVPDGLMGVSNGRLVERVDARPGWATWRWRHDYPIDTYGVCLNVGPYEMVAERIALPELDKPLLFAYFVLPEHLDRARAQFAEVHEILALYSRSFGPWPFPTSKVGLVDSTYLSADHSTIVGYGSSYPTWLAQHGLEDPYAGLNRGYDYILAHQLAHEWWGNAVAAASWNDYWLHEGFATYAESLLLEQREGRSRSDAFFVKLASRIGKSSRLVRPGDLDAREAFSRVLHVKGAWVLHMIRHYLGEDRVWWDILRRFQREHRYATASTEDFRRVVEAETGEDWKCFFDEWVRGQGYPRLEGTVRVLEDRLLVDVTNALAPGRCFHVPLDLEWIEDGKPVQRRLRLVPGENRTEVPCGASPTDVRVVNLQRLLGRHSVRVEER